MRSASFKMPRARPASRVPDQLLTDDVIYPYLNCFQTETFSYGGRENLKWQYQDVRSSDTDRTSDGGTTADTNLDERQKRRMKLRRLIAVDEEGAVCHDFVERGRTEPLQPQEWAQILTEGGKNEFPGLYPDWLPDHTYEHFHKAVENAWRPIKAAVRTRWQSVYGQQVIRNEDRS